MSKSPNTMREARRARALTQVDLARLTGIEQSRLSAIETGRTRNPSWATVKRIADALGVRPEKVFPIHGRTTEAA